MAAKGRTQDHLAEWVRSKPVEGTLRPNEALQKIVIIKPNYSRPKEEWNNACKAKEVMEELQELQEGHFTNDGELLEGDFTKDGELQEGDFTKSGDMWQPSTYT